MRESYNCCFLSNKIVHYTERSLNVISCVAKYLSVFLCPAMGIDISKLFTDLITCLERANHYTKAEFR